jgi:putative oxidoreductase
MKYHEYSKYTVLIGRILFSAIFILASLGHFSSQTILYAANRGVPMATILVPFSGLLALLGGVSVLLGYRARIGAWLLVLFLVPVTVMMHSFWSIPDAKAAMIEQIMFMKNLSMLGGALLITYFGSGPLSLSHKE